MDALLDRLHEALGPRGVVTDAAELQARGTDWRGVFHGRPAALLRPDGTEAVAAMVRLCAAAGVAMVPQGGNTSMAGGATPDASGRQVLVSLERMNRVRDLDPLDMTMVAEAGVVVRAAQDAAAAAGCLFPLSFGAEGSATIGGALSTNAGGNLTVRYGNARDLVLGLEVVLPDGSVVDGLRRLRKDNTGYAWRHLFVGGEGTLGFVTAAALRLFPAAREGATALCAVPDPAAALALFRRFRAAEEGAVRSFEYLSGAGVDLVLRHVDGVALPLADPSPHYALVDLTASRADAGLRALLEGVLEAAFAAGEVTDAALAESEAQRAALWRLREEHTEAQRRAGASLKHDVSVPVARTPDLLRDAAAACLAVAPGCRPAPFGHLGDGNIHFNVVQPEGADGGAFLTQAGAIGDAVGGVVRALGGSPSAEHGIGQLKTGLMETWRGGAELALMRRIKAAIDPQGLMNPGKLLP